MKLVLLAGVLLLAACATKPQLESRSAANPAGIDLSGSWILRAEAGAPLERQGEQPQTIRIPERSSSRQPQRQTREPRSETPDVWIFLETGRSLRVTQTSDGLFISFDRAVVEEFTFGENRMVSVGPIAAQRVSGWVGSELVVETMDEEGLMLTETWSLEEGGAVLVRLVSVTEDGRQAFSTRQVFDRLESGR